MQSIIDDEAENYWRRLLLEEANRQFAELRADPVAWQEELEERAIWDDTMLFSAYIGQGNCTYAYRD